MLPLCVHVGSRELVTVCVAYVGTKSTKPDLSLVNVGGSMGLITMWDDLGDEAYDGTEGGVPEDLWGALPHVDFVPLNDRVLVKREDAATMTKGGLVLPEEGKTKPTTALVLAVGTGHILPDGRVRPLTVKRGDRVVFGKYNGEDVTVGDKTFLLLQEKDIYGIVGGAS